jgi:hypothetical protein
MARCCVHFESQKPEFLSRVVFTLSARQRAEVAFLPKYDLGSCVVACSSVQNNNINNNACFQFKDLASFQRPILNFAPMGKL